MLTSSDGREQEKIKPMSKKNTSNKRKPAVSQGPRELLEMILRRCDDRAEENPGSPTKHISLNMDANLHHRLKIFCVRQNTNVSSVVGDLVAAHLAKYNS